MDNLRYWTQLKTPPSDALKTIKAGRLKGFFDIDPVWRFEALTNTFGPCGVGWKYEIRRTWVEPGAAGAVFAFAEVAISYVRRYSDEGEPQEWSSWIPAIGGSMLVAKESAGLHCNDEAFAMSVTDGLGKAAKALGLAADVYRGQVDAKYTTGEPERSRPAPKRVQAGDVKWERKPKKNTDGESEQDGDLSDDVVKMKNGEEWKPGEESDLLDDIEVELKSGKMFKLRQHPGHDDKIHLRPNVQVALVVGARVKAKELELKDKHAASVALQQACDHYGFEHYSMIPWRETGEGKPFDLIKEYAEQILETMAEEDQYGG